MNAFEAFRRLSGGELVPLEHGPNGPLCSEGQMIVLRTLTEELPRVTLCGEVLTANSLRRDGDGFAGEFERLIDMWAGRSVFMLEGGSSPQKLQLDIGPHKKKLGPGAWEALIQELCDVAATLPWGMSPGAASGIMTPDALSTVHPAIIEHELSGFRRLLRQLLADPPTRTLRIRAIRPLDMSRGADLRTLRWISRRPLELAGLRGLALEDQPPNPRVLTDQPATVTSLDHPITRYIAYLLDRVRLRLERTVLRLRLPAGHGVPDPAATAYADQLASDVEAAVIAIETVQRAPLFRAVRPEPLSDSVLQSLPDHPLYSAIHRVGRRLLDPGLAYAPGQDIHSALKHSYDLFELMVLYRLVKNIDAGLGPDWTLKRRGGIARLPREDRPRDRSKWVWRGPDQRVLELRYQALFSSANSPPDSRFLTSVSAQGVPDYILIYRHRGRMVSWIILDAKYRCGRQSIHDALADIHRYRDSLRVLGQPAAAAFIIVPNLADDAMLYGQLDFIGIQNFGALNVYTEGWMDPVWSWLQGAQGPMSRTDPRLKREALAAAEPGAANARPLRNPPPPDTLPPLARDLPS